MSRIVYREGKDVVTVVLDGKTVGHIRRLAYDLGWVYAAKGGLAKGDVFKTLAACKRSLEEPQDD